jgi:hypothetical protein
MTKKTCLRFVFSLALVATTLGLVGPASETEAVLLCPSVYCMSLSCAAPCVRSLGRCTACSGGDTPARYFRCISPSTGAQCGSNTGQYCLDPSCLG